MQGYEVILSSQIDGEFEGFDDEVFFQLMDGTCWVQDEYYYWCMFRPFPITHFGSIRSLISV